MVTTPIPATMRAVEITTPGGPDVLKPCVRPLPQPRNDEVLIAVEAAGVNRPDVLQRKGNYAPPPDASDLPGLEIAGRIAAVGSAVKDLAVGERVCALVPGGGYAEFATAHAGSCLPVPGDLSAIEAAAIPETFFTVWHNVFQRGALKAGETLLVHGGSSGIGTTAIQLAKAVGATVAVTAGSDEKCEVCRKLGADMAINYRTTDFGEAIAASPLKSVDVILDMVGGEYFGRNVKCLRPDGRLVLIAVLKGAKAEADLAAVMMKRLTVTGSTLRPRDNAFKAALARDLRAQVWPLLSTRKVAPLIHKVFDLADAASAHGLMESSAHMGKIVLKIK